MADTITKGLIGENDLKHYDGVSDTFNRPTSTGGSTTLRKVGAEVDVLMAYGGGSSFSKASIDSAISAMGSTVRSLVLRPGVWVVDDDLTIPSNINLNVMAGALLEISSGKTLTMSGLVDAGPYQIFSGSGTVSMSSVMKLYPEWWGATYAALQACITAAASGSEVIINSDYTITDDITISSKSDLLIHGNGTITISSGASDAKCFDLVGTIDNLTIRDLTLIGDGNAAYTQYGIGAESGQTISNTHFENLKIRDVNVGISINANTSGSWVNAWVINCHLKDISGTSAGQGYGIHVATGANAAAAQDGRVFLTNNVIDNASRHSIYIAHTKNVSIVGGCVKNHRKDVYDGSIRGALSIARSENVTVTGVTLSDCYGGAMTIMSVRNEDSDYEDSGIVIQGCVFENYPENGIYLGYLTPAYDYPVNVLITNNIFKPAAASTQTSIRFACGYDVSITNNIIGEKGVTYGGGISAIQVYSTGDSYADFDTYTDNLLIAGNNITLVPSSGATYGVYFSKGFTEGTSHIRARDNLINYDYRYGYATDPTNPNMSVVDIRRSYVIDGEVDCTNGTTTGYAKSTATVYVSYGFGQITSKTATDDLWDLTGVSTGSGEYKKVLLCLDASMDGVIIEGEAAASHTLAKVPLVPHHNYVPVGIVSIPESYSGGSLSGYTFYDIEGIYEQ